MPKTLLHMISCNFLSFLTRAVQFNSQLIDSLFRFDRFSSRKPIPRFWLFQWNHYSPAKNSDRRVMRLKSLLHISAETYHGCNLWQTVTVNLNLQELYLPWCLVINKTLLTSLAHGVARWLSGLNSCELQFSVFYYFPHPFFPWQNLKSSER